MTGVSIEIEFAGLTRAINALDALARPSRRKEALSIVGALGEMQTRERIAREKTSPDGAPWAQWSKGYASSRHPHHSLLLAEGHLLDSLQWQDTADGVEWGSNLVYAAIQQEGGQAGMAPGPAAIPARPYLGLSDSNAREIEDELVSWLGGVLQ